MPENKRYQTSKPIIVIEVKGGMVTDVNSTVPATIMVEDWDCPPDRPLVMDFESAPLWPDQLKRVNERLAEANSLKTDERKMP